LRSGKYVGKQETTVSGYLEEWLRGLHSQKPKTVKGYRDALRIVTDTLGNKPLQSLSKRDLDTLVTKMLSTGGRKGLGRAPRTVELMLTILSAALEAAKQERRLAVNVASLIAKPKNESREQIGEAWTADQARIFLRHIENERFSPAWRMSLYGLRRGEVMGLNWDCINFETSTVKVATTRVVSGGAVITSSTKNREVRTLKVGPEVIADLKRLKALQAVERLAAGSAYTYTGLLLVNEEGTPMRPERYGDLFQQYAKAAGLPRIRLHDLRHTTASLLHSLGLPPVVCANYLGHTTEVFLRTYAHLYKEDEDSAASSLSALYSSAL
jgi:integrase